MVIFVIITNLIITVLNFYLAWRIWQIQSRLVKLKENLVLLDQRLQHTLITAPVLLQQSKHTTASVAIQYRQLRQIIDILSKLLLLWRLSRKRRR